MKRVSLLVFWITVPLSQAFCQESADVQAKAPFLPDAYYEALNLNLPIYNGRVFNMYPIAITGQALFPENHWAPVTVLYDDVWYKAVGRYDRYADELVVRNPDSTCLFMPNRNRVSRFTLEGKTFIRIDSVSSKLATGYYEVIAEGPFSAFRKLGMTMDEDLSGSVVERSFVKQESYYIRRNEQFQQIRSKRNFNDAIKDKKREILQSLKDGGINFKKDPETALRSAARFYK